MSLVINLDDTVFDERNLTLDKPLNFIYGRNGTGKSTLARIISENYSDRYEVRIFNGADEIAQNQRLDAIALGGENAKLTREIEAIDAKISELKNELTLNENINLASELEDAKKAYQSLKTKIDTFCAKSASIIKNKTPRISKSNYDINDFKKDINSAKTLTDKELTECQTIVSTTKKATIDAVQLPRIDIVALTRATKDIILTQVKPSVILKDLADNPEKQQFALDGTKVHARKCGETCAFCGNLITEDRWKTLDYYFDDSIQKLEARIKTGLSRLNDAYDKIDKIVRLEKSDYYDIYSKDISEVNNKIDITKSSLREYISGLISSLNSKRNNLFSVNHHLPSKEPIDFSLEINAEIRRITRKNNDMTNDLVNEQQRRSDSLRYDIIMRQLLEFDFNSNEAELMNAKQKLDEKTKIFNTKKDDLSKLEATKHRLIEQTKNEKAVANKINRKLESIGSSSFKLKLVTDPDGKKGQYKVLGVDGKQRSIEKLSKGELNIVAFLYFLYSLEKIDRTKPPIIIFDDPMTSNDDTMQYLIIGELFDFYTVFRDTHQNNSGFMILMTHNCQFFLNVRPNTIGFRHNDNNLINYYERDSYFHFLSDGKNTKVIKIQNKSDDFANNYELLWQELKYLYNNNKPSLMLGPARKICETYCSFNSINGNTFYKNNGAARKLFNSNQHSPYDLDAEQNGRSREEIIRLLKCVFDSNNAVEHFNNNWQ